MCFCMRCRKSSPSTPVANTEGGTTSFHAIDWSNSLLSFTDMGGPERLPGQSLVANVLTNSTGHVSPESVTGR